MLNLNVSVYILIVDVEHIILSGLYERNYNRTSKHNQLINIGGIEDVFNKFSQFEISNTLILSNSTCSRTRNSFTENSTLLTRLQINVFFKP